MKYKVKEYRVVEADYPSLLQERVQCHLQADWEPVGGICVVPCGNNAAGSFSQIFYQAIYREIEKSDEPDVVVNLQWCPPLCEPDKKLENPCPTCGMAMYATNGTCDFCKMRSSNLTAAVNKYDDRGPQ